MHVRTALFPVGGLGTRFLPATKAIPKEMLPILDKPLIQYAVEEARDAGIERFIFVTGKGKTAIEDHFDRAPLFEETLRAREQTQLLKRLSIQGIAPGAFAFVRQHQPLGLGHAIWCARHYLNEPFAVLLADDFVIGPQPEINLLMHAQHKNGGSWLSTQKVHSEEINRYGIIEAHNDASGRQQITKLTEKPACGSTLSTTAIMGRYVLSLRVLDILDEAVQKPKMNEEIQLTDALSTLLSKDPIYHLPIQGRRFDCGQLEGMFRATCFLASKHPDLSNITLDKEHIEQKERIKCG